MSHLIRKLIYFTYFSLLISPSLLWAQGSGNKGVDRLLETAALQMQNEDYFGAAQSYSKAVDKKPDDYSLNLKLADAYRLNNDYPEAEKWYTRCVKLSPNKTTIALYRLATMQKVNEKYYDAEQSLTTFIKTFKPFTDEERVLSRRAQIEYKGCLLVMELLQEPEKDIELTLMPFPVNTKNSDFAPLIFLHDSSLVITSARADSKGGTLNTSSGEARTDNFRFDKKGDRWLRTDNEDNFDIVNTANDDGAGSLTKNKTKYYYTICDPECGIYVSSKTDGKFGAPVKLNAAINAGYWNAQPSLTANGDTMYFVSKRPGGKGQNDIWMSINRDKSGKTENWAPAKNLAQINTSEVENAPFWDVVTRTLYFSSNGHAGFGGMDIYKTKLAKTDTVANVGLPFNSGKNDYFLVLGKDKGYFVSDRIGGYGSADVYSFNRKIKNVVLSSSDNSFAAGQRITCYGILYHDETHKPLANVAVQLNDERGNPVRKTITNSAGEFNFDSLQSDKNFRLIVDDKDPHIRAVVEYSVKKAGDPQKKLEIPKDEPVVKSIVRKPEKNLQPVAEPQATATPPAPVIEEKKTAPTPVVPVEDNTLAFKNEKTATKNTMSPVKAKPAPAKPAPVVKAKVYFENVYFDFNSSDLLSPAKKTLDELAAFYAANTGIKIEIRSFTDSFGDKEYNQKLSVDRGAACVDYLVSKGVPQSALQNSPQGAGKPLGDNNMYTGRQVNRRVEFSIKGAENPFEPSAMAYVVEPHMTLFSIAKKFDMQVDELKSLNGIEGEYIQAYSVLRVKRLGTANRIAQETMEKIKNGTQEYRFRDMKFIPVGIF